MNNWIHVLPIYMCHDIEHYDFNGKVMYSTKL
jgi:hypothetical protein